MIMSYSQPEFPGHSLFSLNFHFLGPFLGSLDSTFGRSKNFAIVLNKDKTIIVYDDRHLNIRHSNDRHTNISL